MKLHIDIETYSSEAIKTSGAYRYVESLDFEILMLAYTYDDNPVQVIDLAKGEKLPEHILQALRDDTTELWAHNATFERIALKAAGIDTRIDKWHCTSALAASCGLPLSLAAVGEALDLPAKKDSVGTSLIRYFSIPCKPTKTNGGRLRNFPEHAPEKWQAFKDYCKKDVEVERLIEQRLRKYKPTDTERRIYILDQEINDRGVGISREVFTAAMDLDSANTQTLIKQMKYLTGLSNPNSQQQLTSWLSDELGFPVTTLAKDALQEYLESPEKLTEKALHVIKLRQRTSKSSIKKYKAMANCVGADGRGRGFFQYCGASRTGRWAGRLVQLQNLPIICMGDDELTKCRTDLIEGKDLSLYGGVSKSISQLIRTAFVPSKGNKLVVADFSAIEARVLAWFASEQWRLDVFNTHGKIYEASAATMFGVPLESVTKGSDYRSKGKVAELALGYQGGVGALKTMGGEAMGLTGPEMSDIVHKWRAASRKIVYFWEILNRAAIMAAKNHGKTYTLKEHKGLAFRHDGDFLLITLPSGRNLMYKGAEIGLNQFGKPSVKYKGLDSHTRKWTWLNTYGGKLAENIVQATARDVLADSMLRLDAAGHDIVLHVHDETAIDSPVHGCLSEVEKIMGSEIPWAKGLPLNAEGYESDYYKKD